MQMRVCTMGRRLQHRVVAIALLLLVLLPPPPTAVSAPSLPAAGTANSLIESFATSIQIQTKEIVKSLFKEFLQDEAKNILKKCAELLQAKIKRGQHEEEKSADSAAGFFIFNLTAGTPWPQTISGVLDISTELVWTQCAPCSECPVPTFQPNMSGTFASLPCWSDMCKKNVPGQTCGRNHSNDPCQYIAVYGNDTNTAGLLAKDTFTFDSTPAPGLVFGCSNAALGNFSSASGVFGFNRGALSLVTQLRLSWFSYLWASNESESQIKFGGDPAPRAPNSRSTCLLTRLDYPDMYFVRLTGIRVDGEDLGAIPAGTFDFQPNGSGGVLLSTTVPITYLEQDAYCVVKEAIAAKITVAKPVDGSAVGLDLCYKAESLNKVKVPNLALVFGDAVMNLNRYNYFFNDSDSGLDCLTILPCLGGSVLGSLAQKGTNMTYDIAGQQLIFEQRDDASPAHSMESLMTMLPYYLAVWAVLF